MAEKAPQQPTGGKVPAGGDGDGRPAAERSSDGSQRPPTKAELAAEPLRRAKEAEAPVEGRVIGWNRGGFHVVVGGVTAFCPRSEMEMDAPRAPRTYLDRIYRFRVLNVQNRGKRVVLSRAAILRAERAERMAKVLSNVIPGTVLGGVVTSLTDFGAFIDLGGVEGLVHVSEIRRQRVDHPSQALRVGQEVEVKVMKVEEGRERISLSMKALEPDPWSGIEERLPEGSVVKGRVERTTRAGAFIELAPGVTGLLPASLMALPKATPATRAFPAGKRVSVQIVSLDRRRRRISLAPEGSKVAEGDPSDYRAYLEEQRRARDAEGFYPLASAFRKLDKRRS